MAKLKVDSWADLINLLCIIGHTEVLNLTQTVLQQAIISISVIKAIIMPLCFSNGTLLFLHHSRYWFKISFFIVERTGNMKVGDFLDCLLELNILSIAELWNIVTRFYAQLWLLFILLEYLFYLSDLYEVRIGHLGIVYCDLILVWLSPLTVLFLFIPFSFRWWFYSLSAFNLFFLVCLKYFLMVYYQRRNRWWQRAKRIII